MTTIATNQNPTDQIPQSTEQQPTANLNLPAAASAGPAKLLTAGLSNMLVDQESQERTFEEVSAIQESADERDLESETPTNGNLVPEMSNLLKFDFQSLQDVMDGFQANLDKQRKKLK